MYDRWNLMHPKWLVLFEKGNSITKISILKVKKKKPNKKANKNKKKNYNK